MHKLYWVTTADHDEDSFVVAKNKRSAACFHERFEGYDYKMAHAEFISDIENSLYSHQIIPAYADKEILGKLGFEIIEGLLSTTIRKNGKTYRSTTTLYNVVSEVANERKGGVYILRMLGTMKHKIGITNNFSQRLQTLQTGNPEVLEILGCYTCESPSRRKELEERIHKKYKENRIGGEWYHLTSEEFQALDVLMYELTQSK